MFLITGTLPSQPYEDALRLALSLSGNDASRMIDHFIAGSGETLIFDDTTEISQNIKAHREFRRLVETITNRLRGRLKGQVPGAIDYQAVLQSLSFNNLDMTSLSDPEVGMPVGGTQGLKIIVERITYHPENNTYSCDLKIHVYDVFGVNQDDRYMLGLVDFWFLQHVQEMEGNHRPFINEFVIRETIAFTAN